MYSKFSFSNLHERLSENIKSLYASNPVLKEIENLDPVFAGGYPMALLFAPRDKAGKIGSYYSTTTYTFRTLTIAQLQLKSLSLTQRIMNNFLLRMQRL